MLPVLAALLLVLSVGCGGEVVEEEFDGVDEPYLMNGTPTTNPFVVKYCGGGTCCTGTFVGPRALLSSRHCSPGLQVGQYLSVRRYHQRSGGEVTYDFQVKELLRHAYGVDGLLLIELNRDVGPHTGVCQELFEPGDVVKRYGAGGTDPDGNHQDGILRTATQHVFASGHADYGMGPRHGSPGDSGGPFMHENSVMGVTWGHRWKQGLWDVITGTRKEWDVATNLADGWVFQQGIQVAKRRCRPDLSLAWARGSGRGMFNRVTAGTSGFWWVPAEWTNTIEFKNEYGQAMGSLYLGGGAKAKGSARADKGFCMIVASGDRINFYQSDGDHCRSPAGTIYLQGANLRGTSTAGGSAGGHFGGVTGRLRTIELRGTARSGSLGSLYFRP